MSKSGFLASTILSKEFERRKNLNSLYSLRAFSRDLGISKTSLSEILGNKRRPSLKAINKIESRLKLSADIVQRLIHESQMGVSSTHYILKENELSSLISKWYYYAILNLAKVEDNSADVSWIVDRLGIESEEALDALNVLQELGHLEIKDGKLTRLSPHLSTVCEVQCHEIQNFHDQVLQKAQTSLRGVPVPLRDYTSIIMAIDIDKLPKAKEMVFKFHRRLAAFLEKGANKRVYSLAIQLFPIDKGRVS